MTKEELRDYVEERWNSDIIPYYVYSTLIDGIDTLEQEPCDEQDVHLRAYREGYDKGYADGDFFARHEGEIKESCEDCVSRADVIRITEETGALETQIRIKALPSVQPTAKENLAVDAVSRADVLDLCDSKDPNYRICDLREDVECLPSFRSERARGEWIPSRDNDFCYVLKCRICGFINEYGLDDNSESTYNFCPNCGADMRGEQE